ncbi:MAG TPA: amidohydrolase family protein [Dehalococcoidia bacterium]|nr:amidohydrolase family protein [Dehalococcoidia bacterium]
MTIDVHCHLYAEGFYNESFVGPTAINTELGGTSGWHSLDPDGSGHIQRMNEAGIDRCNILHIDMGVLFGEGALAIEQQNHHISEVVRKHKDQFTWFCGVDPRRKEAAELSEKCISQWGASGIKLYPTTGFLPADKECYPLYEVAVSKQVPVYFHMGPEAPPYKNEGNAHPSGLLRVLVDFSGLTVVVAHLSFEYWRDLITLGKVCDNVMADFCAWQRIAQRSYDQFCHILRRFLDQFGSDRVMFGTDAPLVELAMSSKEWVEMVKRLPHDSPKGVAFSEEEIGALLDGNARRLFATIKQQVD